VSAGGEAREHSPTQSLACQKIVVEKSTSCQKIFCPFTAENRIIFFNLGAKLKILSTKISSVGNFQLPVGFSRKFAVHVEKLQLFALPTV